MDRWEYKSFLAEGPKLEEFLRPWGDQGWEVVNFAPVTHEFADRFYAPPNWAVSKWNATQYRILLKRRKP